MLRKEAIKNDKVEQLAAQDDITGKQLWNRVKQMAGWVSSLSPTKFSTNNGMITDPTQMANLLNDFFCTKIQKLCNELELRNLTDPLLLLRENFNKWMSNCRYGPLK